MRWPFSKPKPEAPAAERIRAIRACAAHLDNAELVNCIVGLVSDRRFTADQRSRLFLRLGGVAVAHSPRPDR